MFPLPYCLLGVALLLPLSFLSAKTYIWTDVNGQKIEAAFVRSTADSVTISIDGQELDLPLDSLSAFSKALALKLKAELDSNTSPPPPKTYTLGRTCRAESSKPNLLKQPAQRLNYCGTVSPSSYR